ncbi:MAG: hypothetical protein AAF357_07500, partial [Verrucomicrobiota bacterium]
WDRRTVAAPVYDHLLIDEAQFFAPVWFDLLLKVLRPGGHLFLCADPTQGFLRRRHSWSKLGIDVRSRCHQLEKSYRSSRAVLQFAAQFYRSRLPDDDEPLNLPSSAWLDSICEGTKPIVKPISGGENQLRDLISELKAFREGGGVLGDVLVLIAGIDLKPKQVAERLSAQIGTKFVGEISRNDFPETALGVTHLMAATGLERPVIFLLGIDELFAKEKSAALDQGERDDLIRDHTRQNYVGHTRAIERLVIYSTSSIFGNEQS